ncbi:MAG TPA: peptide chain release factor N(5)-glutamine methyltransferase [Rhizobium sp.]|nr:peptide chain release factor N(5)-glutamine methyltransferase [Rhizobium sp.]
MTNQAETVSGLTAQAKRRFAEAGLSTPSTDARILISGLLGLSLSQVIVRGSDTVPPKECVQIREAIERRVRREPVYRILGHREFYGLDLQLSPATLEPRPDTEILVDHVLPHLRRIVAENGRARVLDLGTGTGAIALALLKECPQAVAVGSDISQDALSIARRNADLNGVADRFETVQSAWFESVNGLFDIIVSNPPYIPTAAVADLEPEVRNYDPAAALDGGEDGLDAYRAIAEKVGDFVRPGGIVAVEIGHDQKDAVSYVFEKAGFLHDEAFRDYGGNDRVLLFAQALPG